MGGSSMKPVAASSPPFLPAAMLSRDRRPPPAWLGRSAAALTMYLGGAAVVLLGLLLSGCAGLSLSQKIPQDAVARLSPVPEVVSGAVAWERTLGYIEDHPGSNYVVGIGDSMLPLYHSGALIILERPQVWDLKVGQTVVFVNAERELVAHVLVKYGAGQGITRGLNNSDDDVDVLTDSSFVGVVVKAYQPAVSEYLADRGPLPGKAAVAGAMVLARFKR